MRDQLFVARIAGSRREPGRPPEPWAAVVRFLADTWLDDYDPRGTASGIVETHQAGFAYLFDTLPGRLIAAWGVSQGRNAAPRPKARMAGHPLGAGPDYHRGHAIPHTLGGETDINLVPQLGAVNTGDFRALEKEAVATPGALYFTYWRYDRGSESQKPAGVDQGLLIPGRVPTVRRHRN